MPCPSHLFHLRQKPWNFASPSDTLSGRHKIIDPPPAVFRKLFVGRAALHTELLALRQQGAVLKRKRSRPSLRMSDGINGRDREKYFADDERKPRASRGSFVKEPDPTNADKALLILGIATRKPDLQQFKSKREWLLLEPWAVQAALSRRRGGRKLTEKEIEDIRRCTRDAATLRWPRGTAK